MSLPALNKFFLFGIVDAIESDHFNFITANIVPMVGDSFLTEDEIEKSRPRLERRNLLQKYDTDSHIDLLFGLDFLEKSKIIQRNSKVFSEETRKNLKKCHTILEKITPLRNDIVHGRPIDYTDFVITHDAAIALSSLIPDYAKLNEVLRIFSEAPKQLIREDYVLIDTETPPIWNNLPEPEHFVTGFFARRKELNQLREIILGRQPVISVTGSGGFGKTALVLELMHQIAVSGETDFDGILWVTAKANRLGVRGIEPLKNVIASSDALFNAAIREFEEVDHGQDKRLLELADAMNLIVVIDNLETVLDDKIKKFANAFQNLNQSKLVFTSRIPINIGAAISLTEFNAKQAMGYLKTVSRAFGVTSLDKVNEETLEKYCRRLRYSPLFIKWFVEGIKQGISPERLVANPERAIEFCLENVFEVMTDNSNKVAEVLAILNSCPKLVIGYLLDMDELEVEEALNELIAYNVGFMRSNIDTNETVFSLFEMSAAYVSRIKPQRLKETGNLRDRYREINDKLSELTKDSQFHSFQHSHIDVQNRDHVVVFSNLLNAYRQGRSGNIESAYTLIEKAKRMAPSYAETYRVEAFVASTEWEKDLSRADQCYVTALEIDPESARLNYFYSSFLLKSADDLPRALEYANRALELEPDAADVQLLLVSINNQRGDFFESFRCLDLAMARLSSQWQWNSWEFGLLSACNVLNREGRNSSNIDLHAAAQQVSGFFEHTLRRQSALQLDAVRERFYQRCENTLKDFLDVTQQRDDRISNLILSFQNAVLSSQKSRERYQGEGISLGVARGDFSKGYAFLTPKDASSGYFIHESEFSDSEWEDICNGATCEFVASEDENGRPKANEVRIL